ncbi:hypothetical protein HYPSUDRAFT_48280 [Hypholoma sublateritium FD-334 SS-4]|uniref:Uncharacterized protein n=1 Tax=Hypholoma sublateritium (strain FD-334 SS-4) TaxID=945553 RepID=A0A0D2NFQ6_HYPSF|nr:hypothetical protein HYPSUDRAFT_48280 [Hypholoma sublateritium FD-334 SS-4]
MRATRSALFAQCTPRQRPWRLWTSPARALSRCLYHRRRRRRWTVVENALHPVDFGRCKERERSGDSNVRDMNAVAQRLRGLKLKGC